MFVMKEILPEVPRWKAMSKAIDDGAKAIGKRLQMAHEKTVLTWEHDVEFDVTYNRRIGRPITARIEVTVDTDDEIWHWVNEGTKGPYPIRPKRPDGILAFPSQFRPKTVPGSSRSRAGHSGGPTAFARVVKHPGIEARDFTGTIEEEQRAWVNRRWRRALDEALGISGHAIS